MSQPALDLDFDLDDGGEPTYRVGELAELVNTLFRRHLPDGVWVRGEIRGLQTRNGHTYFTLTDVGDDGRTATVNVALFANVAAQLRPLLRRHRLALADGLAVRVHGHLDFYPPSGRLSLRMDGLDPRYTLGELALRRDEVARRLATEGLLDANGRLVLPAVPLRVGVVTSVRSAAWHDVVGELARSGFGFHVVAADARVQGDGAVGEVVQALRTLGRHDLDVIMLVRGGGAKSDLAAFDAEAIARAIATCPLPVLTGLGHEIDRSLADEVAHTSLKTPTACAAALVDRVQAYVDATETAWSAIAVSAGHRLRTERARLDSLAHRAASETRAALGLADQRVVDRANRLGRAALAAATAGSRHLDHVEARLRALDPARTLARGWSITRRDDGSLVRDASSLRLGDQLVTTFAAGAARSRVEEATP